ncbi:sensor histidine kinase [Curtobacterium sp. MCLR17_007]|uniref:sensor histidine kinase n=1 Tax=Curtobacterium sp. MCLR17_007 TaxID=2175648 RepID=UPI000DA71B55|nr:ATP-binding protein [Curtobacterium sp. MCLR17_007]WIB59116.1 sensor histidine kinase [Curtobacterium sp. MCLR17_007]
MTTEVAPFGVDPSRNVRATVSQASVERAFAILLAVFAIGFGAVNVTTVLNQQRFLDVTGGVVLPVALAAAFMLVGVSVFVPRLVQPAQIVTALLFLVVLVVWPFTVERPLVGQQPWPWFICNVGTVAAAMGFATWRAVVYTAVVPVVYAVIRLTPAGGDAGVLRAVVDGVFIGILGGAALALIVMLRRAAAAVDSAQATAVRRYSHAIREHATEVERIQVDAIVHDSVLTTLLSAARADTPDGRMLSARMARNAIDHLAAAGDTPEDVPPVRLAELRARIAQAVDELAVPVTVRLGAISSRTVPAAVADALASAALQAAVNSVQHAGPTASRWVTVDHTAGVVRIEVGDDGVGFDQAAIPAERLGVRRSILERVASAGGAARIDSAPGSGTRVVLTWPAPGAGEQ